MEIKDQEIKLFQQTIRDNSAYDFNDYSVNSLKRRLTKILREHDSNMKSLVKNLRSDGQFLEEIVKKITVNTTELFRDPNIWKEFMLKVMPLFKNLSSIQVWHPGCSTGQEVYSMMILLDQFGLFEKSRIFASDINSDVMEVAKKGEYRLRFNREYIENFNAVFSNGLNGSSELKFAGWERYFKTDEAKDLIIMNDRLRNKPVYNKIDLVKDDNLFFVNFDLIICRNVIIYFNYELQNKVLGLLHRNLNENGCLVLGMHESIIGPGSKLFQKDDLFYFKRKQ